MSRKKGGTPAGRKRKVMPNMSLANETIRLIEESELTTMDMFAGCGVSPYWIESFVKGKVANPGVNYVQAVYEFLSGRELFPNDRNS